MLKIIESEFLKQKRSRVMILTILGTVFIPFMYLISGLHHKIEDPTITYTLSGIYGDVSLYFFMLFAVILFSLIISNNFAIEFNNHTLKSILTTPISKNDIILSKIMMSIIWVLILILILFVSSTLTGLILDSGDITLKLIYENACKYLIGGFLLSLSMIIFVFIALKFKNTIACVILGVMISFSNSIIMNSNYAPLSPWNSPILIASGDVAKYSYGLQLPILLIVFVFIVATLSSIIYFKFSDVDL